MAHWYGRKSPEALFAVPEATSTQLQHARSVLRVGGRISLDDYDGHVGAVALYRNAMRRAARRPPTREDLMAAVRASVRRPGFDADNCISMSTGQEKWAWIRPETITHNSLGRPFKPYHYSNAGLVKFAFRVLGEEGNPEGMAELFGGPRLHMPFIHVYELNSFDSPIRVVAANGNHRTIVLRALGAPLVLAEIRVWAPPYRLVVHEAAVPIVRAYLLWLRDRAVITLPRRPRIGNEFRVSSAAASWLLRHPADATRALRVFLRITGRSDLRIGDVTAAELLARWKDVPRPERQQVTSITLRATSDR